jgi:hypothetical protein
MNHTAEESNIGKLDFDCLILVGKVGNGKWTLTISNSRTFGLVLLVIEGLRLLSRLDIHITLVECN